MHDRLQKEIVSDRYTLKKRSLRRKAIKNLMTPLSVSRIDLPRLSLPYNTAQSRTFDKRSLKSSRTWRI